MSIKQQLVDDLAKLEQDNESGLLTSIEYTLQEFAIKKSYRDSMSKARKRIIYNK